MADTPKKRIHKPRNTTSIVPTAVVTKTEVAEVDPVESLRKEELYGVDIRGKIPRKSKKTKVEVPAPLEKASLTGPATERPIEKDTLGLEAPSKKSERYIEAVGRRKTAIARVRLFTRSGEFSVNGKSYSDYFPTMVLQKTVEDALKKMKLWERFRVSALVSGGGIRAQAEAIRHGLARCLINFNPDFRKRLKKAGFLTRDPRMKERKKFGLKKARRAPQWQKR